MSQLDEYEWKQEVLKIIKTMIKIQQGINLRLMELEDANKKRN